MQINGLDVTAVEKFYCSRDKKEEMTRFLDGIFELLFAAAAKSSSFMLDEVDGSFFFSDC